MPSAMFGHAASRWGSRQGENLATSALVYLLNTYPEATSAFVATIAELSPDPPRFDRELRFVEQLVSDGGRIDAAGLDKGRARRLLIECKFGAVLGDSQIDGYLQELAEPGVLLFIVPRLRRPETLAQVCRILRLTPEAFADSGGFAVAPIDPQSVAVSDWISVLDVLGEVQGDTEFMAELAQLRSYADLMTGDDFIALAPEEVASRTGGRWRQFTEIFEEAVAEAQLQGHLTTDGSLSGSHGYSGRGLRIGPWLVWGGTWAGPWADTAETPLWLQITGGEGRPEPALALQALAGFGEGGPSRVFERREQVVVPLYLKYAADRAEVVADVVSQLAAVRAAINEFTGGRIDDSTPEETGGVGADVSE